MLAQVCHEDISPFLQRRLAHDLTRLYNIEGVKVEVHEILISTTSELTHSRPSLKLSHRPPVSEFFWRTLPLLFFTLLAMVNQALKYSSTTQCSYLHPRWTFYMSCGILLVLWWISSGEVKAVLNFITIPLICEFLTGERDCEKKLRTPCDIAKLQHAPWWREWPAGYAQDDYKVWTYDSKVCTL